MSKLMEQVKEIQARAHMCPECEGTGEVETHPYGWLMPCDECDGTGEVPAPDIDALVGAIEVLIAAVKEANEEVYFLSEYDTQNKAADLVHNGLPEEGEHV